MPFISSRGATLYYEVHGAGPAVIFSHGLGGHTFLLDYEMVNVDLFAGDQFKPEFLALNPYHKVPLLDDGAVAVPESWIINEYLEDPPPVRRLSCPTAPPSAPACAGSSTSPTASSSPASTIS